ncbi:hypothetical protein ACLOJK_023765 [Asimina triloba]
MSRPLEGDCELKLFKFDDKEGCDTFWHSSAHILGQGFYYDAFYGDVTLNEDDLKKVDAQAKMVNKFIFTNEVAGKKNLPVHTESQPFERIEVEIIKELPEDKTITVYRCGPLVDLCRGPHIPNTSFVKAVKCLKASSSYWRGQKDRESLQRVYGISYPDEKRLKVLTPNIYNMQLWETSGHAANYKENMFVFEIEKQEFGLKPMNCPGHCLMFDNRVRSYRELPLRLADFGVLHRNELSGALTGLTRVRRFQQDDAHIFCRENQRLTLSVKLLLVVEDFTMVLIDMDNAFVEIKDEVRAVLEFIDYAYKVFGFTYELELSTRPEKYLGEIETWEKAEAALAEALNEFGKPWKPNEGDGAFYGPKIDISVFDAMKRKFQCATLQLDFQLPSRFNLSYSAEDEAKRERPVMIHRAILGSVERMLAILLEHYKGKWPFWLSPRQAIVCPVSEKSQPYALQVKDQIHQAGYYVDVDTTDRKIQKKVREAQLAQYNYILVVGEEEANTGQVSVRVRDKGDHQVMSMADLLNHFGVETAKYH